MRMVPTPPLQVPRRAAILLAAVLAGIGVCGTLAERSAGPDAVPRTRYDAAIRRAARRHLPAGWDWRILKAMAYQESRLDPQATSPAGAIGLCQVLPTSARPLGHSPADLTQPEANLDAGARLLRECWDAADGFPDGPPGWERSRAAVAAYHAGIAALRAAREAAGPAGRSSWRAVRAQLPSGVRRHVEAVFDQALPQVRRLHPGGRGGGSCGTPRLSGACAPVELRPPVRRISLGSWPDAGTPPPSLRQPGGSRV